MALREILARFGFQVDQRGLKKAQTGIAGVVGSLKTLGVTIGAGIVARGIKDFVTGMVDAGDALGKTATQLGLSSKELQAWQQAASFAGVQTESLNQGFRILGKNALLAQQGSKQAGDAFKTLGVEIETANGQLKPANQLAREAGVALGNMEDRTKAVGLAQQVFGRAGAALLPLFAKGAEGLDEALAKLEEFGGGLSDELIPLAEAAQDRFTEFEIATTSLKSKIAVALLPALNQLTLGLSKAITFLSKSGITAESFKSILVALGLALGKLAIAKFGASLLSLGRAALLPLAKFMLLFLVVDDLIALFEGRGSVIGTIIDNIFGKGSAKAVVDGIKGIGKAVSDVVATGDFDKLDKDLDEIFGPLGHDIVADVVFTFEMIGEVIDHAIDGIEQAWDQFWDDLEIDASELLEDAADLADDLIDGIVDGINDGAAAVVKAITGVVGKGIDAAKDLLGIGSPSKVFAEIGGQNIEGLVLGMQKVSKTAAKLTSAAALEASGANARGEISAPAATPAPSAAIATGGVVFKSSINLSVSGGSPSDASIGKLRQGLRRELDDNRRAMLAALTQTVPV